MSIRGGRPLRRQIEAALSGAADPLGEDGLGPPDPPGISRSDDVGDDPSAIDSEADEEGPGAPARRGKRGKERPVDEGVRAA